MQNISFVREPFKSWQASTLVSFTAAINVMF